jgi:hypothetical protein
MIMTLNPKSWSAMAALIPVGPAPAMRTSQSSEIVMTQLQLSSMDQKFVASDSLLFRTVGIIGIFTPMTQCPSGLILKILFL